MNNPPIRLAWTDFVLDLQELLLEKQVRTPLYIVGGAVRDAYMRGLIKDIDIAVDGDAIQFARNITNWFSGDIYVMDRERDVVRVFVETSDGQVILDFAKFRGATLEEDLLDRDFTINAMAADLLGDVSVLVDPLHGEQDLHQKVLRRCTEHSIADDPIRILRAIRQSVQFQLKIHPSTLADLRDNIAGISQSSPERIRDEFFKVLGSQRPSRAIRVLQHLGALEYVIAGVDNLVRLKQDLPHRFGVWNHTLLVVERMNSILTAISYKRTDNTAATFDLGMLVIQLDRYRNQLQTHILRESGTGRSHQELLILGALLHNIGKSETLTDHQSASRIRTREIAKSLQLTNEERSRLKTMVSSYRDVLDKQEWSTLDLHRFWFKLGENGIDACLLAVADYLGMVGAEITQLEWLSIVERIIILLDTYFNRHNEIVNPQLYLNGNEIMEMLNLGGSPIIGKLLTQLREAQVTSQVTSLENARKFVQLQYSKLN